MGRAVEPDQLDQLVDPARDGGGVLAEQAGRDPDVLGHRHVREQADALEHVADAAAQHDRVDGPDVLAGDPDRPFARVDQPVDQAAAAWSCRNRTGRQWPGIRARRPPKTRRRAPCGRHRRSSC